MFACDEKSNGTGEAELEGAGDENPDDAAVASVGSIDALLNVASSCLLTLFET